jgi:hypothetical protein
MFIYHPKANKTNNVRLSIAGIITEDRGFEEWRRLRLSRRLAWMLAASLQKFQRFSNFVIFQCVLNPAGLAGLFALGRKGVFRGFGRLRASYGLLLVGHVLPPDLRVSG